MPCFLCKPEPCKRPILQEIIRLLETGEEQIPEIDPEVTKQFIELAKISGLPYFVTKEGLVIVDYRDWI